MKIDALKFFGSVVITVGVISNMVLAQPNCTDTISVGGGVVLWNFLDSVRPLIHVSNSDFCDGFLIAGKGTQHVLPMREMMVEVVLRNDTMQIISTMGYSGYDSIDHIPFKKGRYRLNFLEMTPVQKRGGEFLNSKPLEHMVLATWWSKRDMKYSRMKDIVFNCFRIGADGLVLEPLGPNEY